MKHFMISALLLVAAQADAHFVWLVPETSTDGSVVVNVIHSDADATIRNESDVLVTAAASDDGNATISAVDDNDIIVVAGAIAGLFGESGSRGAQTGIGADALAAGG